jgi:uracil-DNA glycosylase family 4
LEACKGWLWKELMALRPRGIITFGETISQKMLHMKTSQHIGPFVGDLHLAYLPPLEGVHVMPMWSPVFLLRQGRKVHERVVGDFKKMKDFLQG